MGDGCADILSEFDEFWRLGRGVVGFIRQTSSPVIFIGEPVECIKQGFDFTRKAGVGKDPLEV